MATATAAETERAARSERSRVVALPQRAQDWPYDFEVLSEKELSIDESYQRPLSTFVDEIVADFNPALVGTLIVNRRKGGKQLVIDGQTRLEASRRVGVPVLPCLVYQGLTRQDEALLFSLFQTERRKIRPVQRFKAEVTAGVPRAQHISEVLHGHGLYPADSSGRAGAPGAIGCIVALERIYDNFGLKRVDEVLGVLRAAWPESNQAVVNEMVSGMAAFINRDKPDLDRLVRQLDNITPRELLQRASALRTGRGVGGGSPIYMAEAIGAVYRRRRRGASS